jgi:hypothetical protein
MPPTAVRTWVTVGKIASPWGSGPISLRAASIAAELEVAGGRVDELGVTQDRAQVPGESPLVADESQVGSVLPVEVVLRRAAELLAGGLDGRGRGV